MSHSPLRRVVVALMAVPLLFTAACGSGGFSGGSSSGTVVIVGQKFTEANIMTELYKQLLEQAGFKTEVAFTHTRTGSFAWIVPVTFCTFSEYTNDRA